MSDAGSGQRVRVRAVDADGLPVVRYGTLAAPRATTEPGEEVVVLLDGADAGTVTVDPGCVEPLELTSFELHLRGRDLLTEPDLRRGLTGLWAAEARAAGLVVDALHPVGDGVRDSSEGYLLAELVSAGQHLVLRVVAAMHDGVVVRVDRPNRFEL